MSESVNSIDLLFRRLRSEGRKAFIPFVPAGDPNVLATERLVAELERRGANMIEIGFPYSDPIADGTVIQAAYNRALTSGLRVEDVFRCVGRLADSLALRDGGLPLVGMVSYSLVYRQGPEAFLDRAREAGLSGAIVPDLPVDEAEELGRLASARDLKLIQLATPTTPPDRAARIARTSTGFLYCVSVAGITGERDQLPEALLGQLRWLRHHTDLPLCVGFGVSRPEHVHMLREAVDGVIVGSAIVKRLEQVGRRPFEEVVREIGDLAGSLVAALAAPA